MKVKVLKPFASQDGKMLDVGQEVEVNDGLGADIVRKGYAEEIKEALKESPAPSELGTGAEIRDIGEVVPKAVDVEGPQRNVEELVGKVIVINQFGTRPSQYGKDKEYATVQITEDNGARSWFNTGSGPILDALNQVKDKLPVRCKIAQRKSEKGQRYFALESAKVA